MGSLSGSHFPLDWPHTWRGTGSPQQLGQTDHWGWGEGDEWLDERGRKLMAREDEHLDASRDIFLYILPFKTPGAAQAWLHVQADRLLLLFIKYLNYRLQNKSLC